MFADKMMIKPPSSMDDKIFHHINYGKNREARYLGLLNQKRTMTFKGDWGNECFKIHIRKLMVHKETQQGKKPFFLALDHNFYLSTFFSSFVESRSFAEIIVRVKSTLSRINLSASYTQKIRGCLRRHKFGFLLRSLQWTSTVFISWLKERTYRGPANVQV